MADKDLELSENSERGHLLGPGNAPVTLVEYGDFQCPACGDFVPLHKELLARFGSKLDFVFKHFPLVELHPRAMPAAQAAEAAARQGKFWAMHDRLFGSQDRLEAEDLLRYAREAGLDMARFETDFSSRNVLARIERDINQGQQNGVSGTPTLFINGELYDGPFDEESLRLFIEEASAQNPLPAASRSPRR